MKDNKKMKEYYQVMFFLTKLSFLVGFLVSVYLLLSPDNPDEYNLYAYYVTSENDIETSYIANDIQDIDVLLKYYADKQIKSTNKVIMPLGDDKIWSIPLSAKVKVLDTIDSNIVKVKIIYNERTTEKGYIPIFNLHEEKPFYLP